jgi:hypothetical protein
MILPESKRQMPRDEEGGGNAERSNGDGLSHDNGSQAGKSSKHLGPLMLRLPQREGRILSAERAVPTHSAVFLKDELSFSLISADSRHAMRGDSLWKPDRSRRARAWSNTGNKRKIF